MKLTNLPFELRKPQEEAFDEIKEILEQDKKPQYKEDRGQIGHVFNMATGVGKSLLMALTIAKAYEEGQHKFYVVVPNLLIKDQLRGMLEKRLGELLPGATINMYTFGEDSIKGYGETYPNDVDVLIMNTQVFNRRTNLSSRFNDPTETLGGVSPREFVEAQNPIAIIDEAHRAQGNLTRERLPEYSNLFEFSATNKYDKSKLTYEYSYVHAIRDGYSPPIQFSDVEHPESISQVQREEEQLHVAVAELKNCQKAIDERCEEQGLDYEDHRPMSLVICRDTTHAESVEGKLDERFDLDVLRVDSTTVDDISDELKEIEEDQPDILVACKMLNEGWDNKHVHVIASLRPLRGEHDRPSISAAQLLGRGLRKSFDRDLADDKKLEVHCDCLIVVPREGKDGISEYIREVGADVGLTEEETKEAHNRSSTDLQYLEYTGGLDVPSVKYVAQADIRNLKGLMLEPNRENLESSSAKITRQGMVEDLLDQDVDYEVVNTLNDIKRTEEFDEQEALSIVKDTSYELIKNWIKDNEERYSSDGSLTDEFTKNDLDSKISMYWNYSEVDLGMVDRYISDIVDQTKEFIRENYEVGFLWDGKSYKRHGTIRMREPLDIDQFDHPEKIVYEHDGSPCLPGKMNQSEVELGKILDQDERVEKWAFLPSKHSRISMPYEFGRFYNPDFIAKIDGEMIVFETKGRVDDTVEKKSKAAKRLVRTINAQSDQKWRYKVVHDDDLKKARKSHRPLNLLLPELEKEAKG